MDSECLFEAKYRIVIEIDPTGPDRYRVSSHRAEGGDLSSQRGNNWSQLVRSATRVVEYHEEVDSGRVAPPPAPVAPEPTPPQEQPAPEQVAARSHTIRAITRRAHQAGWTIPVPALREADARLARGDDVRVWVEPGYGLETGVLVPLAEHRRFLDGPYAGGWDSCKRKAMPDYYILLAQDVPGCDPATTSEPVGNGLYRRGK